MMFRGIFFVMVLFVCVQCSATTQKRSLGQVIDDQVIHTKLRARYLRDKQISTKGINIDVWKGTVFLRGVVPEQREIDRAIEIAEKQPGVTEVKAYLVLKNWAKQGAVVLQKTENKTKQKNTLREETIAEEVPSKTGAGDVLAPKGAEDNPTRDVADGDEAIDQEGF